MDKWLESPDAIGAVDAIFAGVGLEHGRRATRSGSWKDGERIKQPKSSVGAKPVKARSAGVVSVDAWVEYPWLRAGFSTRQGGASTAYGDGEQNLGWTKEDLPETVTILEGLRNKFGSTAEISYSQGAQLKRKFPSMFDLLFRVKAEAVW